MKKAEARRVSLMTMILTCLTKNYTVQASDRRFTYPNTPFSPNNDSNKALFYRNHFSFAFTGLAELSLSGTSLPTIVWAADQLRQKGTLGEAVSYLRNQATEKIKSLPCPRFSPQSRFLDFVGAGFQGAEKKKPEDRRPVRIVISNWMGQDGVYPRIPPAQPYRVFNMKYDFLEKKRDFDLFVAGQHLDPGRETDLRQEIGACLKNGEGAHVIGKLLTQAIQATARQNPLVGGIVMCTFVPRVADPNSSMVHLGGFLLDLSLEGNVPTAKLPDNYDPFVLFPDFDGARVIYTSEDGSPSPSYTPINVHPGQVISPIIVSGMGMQFSNTPDTNTP
jgi:hypothetical protein